MLIIFNNLIFKNTELWIWPCSMVHATAARIANRRKIRNRAACIVCGCNYMTSVLLYSFLLFIGNVSVTKTPWLSIQELYYSHDYHKMTTSLAVRGNFALPTVVQLHSATVQREQSQWDWQWLYQHGSSSLKSPSYISQILSVNMHIPGTNAWVWVQKGENLRRLQRLTHGDSNTRNTF